MRRRLRDLVKLIEKRQRKPIYTDFEDEMGGETDVELPGFGAGTDFAKFRAKAQAFLRAHQDHVAIHKLRMNKPLTPTDLTELERMLAESGVGAPEDIDAREGGVAGPRAVRPLAGRAGPRSRQGGARRVSCRARRLRRTRSSSST